MFGVLVGRLVTAGTVMIDGGRGGIADGSDPRDPDDPDGADIQANLAILRADGSVGTHVNDTPQGTVPIKLDTAVNNLDVISENGVGIFLVNQGPLNILRAEARRTEIPVAIVDIMTMSPLTVLGPVSGSSVTLTAMEGASRLSLVDTLTIAAGARIEARSGAVRLNAGDDLSIMAGASVSAASIIDIRLDASPAKNDPFGSVATIAGTLRAAETQVTGGIGVDTFYIAPSTASPITVSSGSSPASSGDVLNVDPRGGQLGVTGNQVVGGGFLPISFTGVGSVNIVAAAPTALQQNPKDPFDVDDDGSVTQLDALLLIGHLRSTTSPPPNLYCDVNGDRTLSRIDPLLIIGQLRQTDGSSGAAFASPSSIVADNQPAERSISNGEGESADQNQVGMLASPAQPMVPAEPTGAAPLLNRGRVDSDYRAALRVPEERSENPWENSPVAKILPAKHNAADEFTARLSRPRSDFGANPISADLEVVLPLIAEDISKNWFPRAATPQTP
jgi:hypothetical protein